MSQELDTTARAVLDAARASVLAFGVRRMALTDVARRAGVSRMTVYRRFGGVDGVLRALLTRELALLIPGGPPAPGTDDRGLGVRLADVAARLRAHPLLAKVRRDEPELLAPYVLERLGATQRHAVAALTRDVADAQSRGEAPPGDPALLAHVLLLVVQAFVLSAGIDPDLPAGRVMGELRPLLERVLAP